MSFFSRAAAMLIATSCAVAFPCAPLPAAAQAAKAQSISGTVVDAATGLPLAGATVSVSVGGSPRIVELASQLYDQAFRYRSIMLANAISAEDFIAEHEKLADVVLSRTGNTAVATLAAHLERTYQDIYGTMPD